MKKIILIILILIPNLLLFSNVAQTERIEIKKEISSENYFISCSEDGLLVFSIDKESGSTGEQIISLTKYDCNLNKTWEKSLNINKKLNINYNYINKSNFYLFFHNRMNGSFNLLSITLKDGKEKKIGGNILKRGILEKFIVVNDVVFFTGNIKNQLILITLDINSNKQNTILLGEKWNSEFKNISIHEKYSKVSVNYYDMKKNTFNCSIFDQSGQLINNIELPQEDEKKIFTSGTLNFINENKIVLLGTYSDDDSSNPHGLYTALIENNNISNIKYHNFSTFKNFFNFLSDFQKELMDKKIERKSKKGKELEVNYNYIEHDLILTNNGYIWLGESYYPTYRNETYFVYINNQPVMQTRIVFNGWIYSHATIAGFNFDGELLWDHCYKIGDLRTFSLKQYVNAIQNNDKILMVYVIGKKIRLMEIKGENVLQDKELIDIDTLDTDKNIIYSYSSIEYWYKNNFLCWGTQRIKDDKEEFGKKRKTVFFVNKISYD